MELVLVALIHCDDRGARFVGAVREDEAWGLSGLEPDAELERRGFVIRHSGAGEQGLDGLRVMDVALGDVAGNDAEDERLREVDAEDLRIIVRVAMHRLCFDFEIVEASDGHALQEVFDVAVAALARIGVRLLVDVEVAEVEHLFVRALQLFVLHEVLVEVPLLRFHDRLAETGFHHPVRGLEVLIHKETGGHERLPDRVHVLHRFLLREIRR